MISKYHVRAVASLADAIVCHLQRTGTRAIFGVPGGGGTLDLIEAAGRAGLPFVLTATETAGAIAAIAQAELTGQPGACLTTLGPGAASVVNGVACALLERTPLLVFTDASADQFTHQQLDHRALFAPITKWSSRLTADGADRVLAHAVATAIAPPAGPVHLDCLAETAIKGTVPFIAVSSTEGEKVEVKGPGPLTTDFCDLLTQSRRPMVVAGLGARGAEDVAALRQFLERRNVPAMVTYKAKGVVPEHHPCFAGVFTNAAIERPMVERSDLIIGVGLDPVELLPRPWTYPHPIVSVGRWPAADTHVPFAAQLVTNIPAAIAAMAACVTTTEWDLDDIQRRVVEQRHRIDIPVRGLSAQRATTLVADALATRTRVTVDAGAHMFAATMMWPVGEPNGMLISNGLSTMGFALPAAIGAALVDRDRSVVALTGDGGLLMCAGELLTAAREKLRIITIVFNDASLSLIEIKQQRKRYQPAGVALGAVDWRAVAEAFGVTAFQAANELELTRAVKDAIQVDGPSLVDVTIDRSNYGATLHAIRGS